MSELVTLLNNWQSVLEAVGPAVAILLFLCGGITYGLAQTQPAENRGKWSTAAYGMLIGGVIVAAITGFASTLQTISANLLK